MAVSGSSGWTPAFGIHIRQGDPRPIPIGYAQNKPRELVYSDNEERCAGDLHAAIALLRSDPQVIVQIDPRYGGFVRLCELWLEEQDG